MPISIACPECSNEIPQPAERCPHCGRPGIFWNVIAATEAVEQAALDGRYRTAIADATSRKVANIVQDFEAAVSQSSVVIARQEGEVLRLATSTRQLYGSYYQQIESGLRLPDGDQWDIVRELTDTLLFPHYKKDIRFGALCLDSVGLANYGTCSIVINEEMIAHRASVFEENSVLFTKRNGIGANKTDLPKGFRGTWADRAKICVAKLAQRIDSTTTPDQYSGLLLKQGITSAEDDFVEVHIWGPLSVLSIKEISVTVPRQRQRMTIIKALNDKLAKYGITVS